MQRYKSKYVMQFNQCKLNLMFRWLCFACLSLIAITFNVKSAQDEPSSMATKEQLELHSRLSMHTAFNASVEQQVFSPENKLILTGDGSLSLARVTKVQEKYLLRYHVTSPDETLLISDGDSLWYYNPFIEQVSIYSQLRAIEQTPFVLMISSDVKKWQGYNIKQEQDLFTLTSVEQTSVSSFQITVNKAGEIKSFAIIEQDGQRSKFNFSNVSFEMPKEQSFIFDIPKGVEIDDQRS